MRSSTAPAPRHPLQRARDAARLDRDAALCATAGALALLVLLILRPGLLP